MSKRTEGWWGIPAADRWRCPECLEWSDPDTWDDTESGCEDCGSHSAIDCPRCGERFDHVWGAEKVGDATEAGEREGEG